MKQEYVNWIVSYQVKHNILAGLCLPACSLMLQSFPELELKRGFIVDGWGKKHSHWWLIYPSTKDIIDPTIDQFNHLFIAGNLIYEEYDINIHGPLATGKCMDCGLFLYNNEKFCNDECAKSTLKYLNIDRNGTF